MPPRLRLPAAFAATLVVAEAAVLLLRPKERFVVAPAEPRAYFSAADLEKAKRFRSGQLRLFGARTALELDTTAKTAIYRRAEYDIAAAQAAIRAARLPESLAERLQYGQ